MSQDVYCRSVQDISDLVTRELAGISTMLLSARMVGLTHMFATCQKSSLISMIYP